MAGSFPPKLKAADLSRFAARAAQLEKLKPVVTYWCTEKHLPSNETVTDRVPLGYYWIVNQILSKGLHKGDTESSAYTTMLMDKLEKVGLTSLLLPAVDADRNLLEDEVGECRERYHNR